MNHRSSTFHYSLLWISIAIISRIIPHPWNITANTALALSTGWLFSNNHALALSLLSFCIADCILAIIQHHPIFGYWSLFSYSGIGAITLAGQLLSRKLKTQHGMLLVSSSIGYWLWTNLGVWLTTTTYSNNLAGLIDCYSMALPFLKSSLIGDSLWFSAIVSTLYLIRSRAQSVAELQ